MPGSMLQEKVNPGDACKCVRRSDDVWVGVAGDGMLRPLVEGEATRHFYVRRRRGSTRYGV